MTVVLCLVALYVFDPTKHAFIPQCPFKWFTGLSCPGCGLQRATHAALHGHLLEAARYNFFLILAIPYVVLLLLTNFFRNRQAWQKLYCVVNSPALALAYVALFMIWWVVRNVVGI